MADKAHFEVSKPMLEQIAQSLLECKKMGRSMENSADALLPLSDNDVVRDLLQQVSDHGQAAAKAATQLYQLIAREAARP